MVKAINNGIELFKTFGKYYPHIYNFNRNMSILQNLIYCLCFPLICPVRLKTACRVKSET